QGEEGAGLGGAVDGDLAQGDQAVAELLGVGRGVQGLVGEDDLGGDGGGDGAGRRADLQGAAREHHQVGHHQLRAEVRAELQGGAALDFHGVEGGGAVGVVGDDGAGVDVHDVAGYRQAAQRPDGRVRPVAALDADEGGPGPEVRDLVPGGHE